MKNKINRSFKKAFTLVELLVVMVIIGILIGLAIFGLSTAQKGGRDTSRKNDLRNIVTALEAYASKNNGSYPDPSTVSFSSTQFVIAGGSVDPVPLKAAGVSGQVISTTPNCAGTGKATSSSTYMAVYLNGSGYTLCTALENDSNNPFIQTRGGND